MYSVPFGLRLTLWEDEGESEIIQYDDVIRLPATSTQF